MPVGGGDVRAAGVVIPLSHDFTTGEVAGNALATPKVDLNLQILGRCA